MSLSPPSIAPSTGVTGINISLNSVDHGLRGQTGHRSMLEAWELGVLAVARFTYDYEEFEGGGRLRRGQEGSSTLGVT